MIGVSSSSKSFAALSQYLVEGKGEEPDDERVVWSSSRNLPTDDPEQAANLMRATAALNVRVKDPVYHLTLSFDPSDSVTRVQMERVADRVLDALGLREHQVLIVAHGDRDHPHMHILVNRVHPETGKVWSRWQDYKVVQEVLRQEERALGLRRVPGRLTEQTSLDLGPEAIQDARVRRPRRRRGDEKLEAIGTDLKSYESVVELGRKRYEAEMEVAAATARLDQVSTAGERARQAREALRQSFTSVYRDPDRALAAFLVAAGERPQQAIRNLRDSPEQFGELGLVATGGRAPRSGRGVPAPSATRAMAAAAQELVDAERTFQAAIRTTHTRGMGQSPPPGGETAIASADLQRARARLAAIRDAELRLPGKRLVERALAHGLLRLTPPEFKRLGLLVTAGQFKIARQIRRVARDVLLDQHEDL